MLGLRAYRREISLVAAYLLLLQTILLALASGARAERAGLELDPGAAVICTPHGLKLVQGEPAPDQAPSRSDCPCCVLGAACGSLLAPFGIVLATLRPAASLDVPDPAPREGTAWYDLRPVPYPARGPPLRAA